MTPLYNSEFLYNIGQQQHQHQPSYGQQQQQQHSHEKQSRKDKNDRRKESTETITTDKADKTQKAPPPLPDWLQHFKLEDLENDRCIGIFGPTGTGKTKIQHKILSVKTFPRGIVFCPSAEANKVYKKWLPPSVIYQYFDREKLREIYMYQTHIANLLTAKLSKEESTAVAKFMADQNDKFTKMRRDLLDTAMKKKWDPTGEKWKRKQIQLDQEIAKLETAETIEWKRKFDAYAETLYAPYRMFIIFDDLGGLGCLKDEILMPLGAQGRHLLICPIFIVQNVMHFRPDLRDSLYWIFLFNYQSLKEWKKVFEHYLSSNVPTVDELRELSELASKHNGLLVFKRNRPYAHWHDAVFFLSRGKMAIHEPPLCSQQFHNITREWLNESKAKNYERELINRMTENNKAKGKKSTKRESGTTGTGGTTGTTSGTIGKPNKGKTSERKSIDTITVSEQWQNLNRPINRPMDFAPLHQPLQSPPVLSEMSKKTKKTKKSKKKGGKRGNKLHKHHKSHSNSNSSNHSESRSSSTSSFDSIADGKQQKTKDNNKDTDKDTEKQLEDQLYYKQMKRKVAARLKEKGKRAKKKALENERQHLYMTKTK